MSLFEKTIRGRAAAAALSATTDIALYTDEHGVIRDVFVSDGNAAGATAADWLNQAFKDVVTPESGPKIDALFEDATASASKMHWRQVNHPTSNGDWAVKYCAIPVAGPVAGNEGTLLVGRDLGGLARLQQQLLEAQNTTERDYWQIRQAETKFRVLFQTSPEAILIADASDQKIVDLNPAAERLLGASLEEENGRAATGIPVKQLFHSSCQDDLANLLVRASISGEASGDDLALASGAEISQTQIALLRQADHALHIVRLRLVRPMPDPRLRQKHLQALEHFDRSPDAMVITDRNGQIIAANPSFSDLAQIVNVEQAIGAALSNWLGQAQVDLNLLLANLRKHGRVRRFNTVVVGTHGVDADVEISATRLFSESDEDAIYGFVIRDVSLRATAAPHADLTTSRSVEELTQLVGRVPLKELVRESADIIERLSIEAALKLTGDNRAAAAEMLGLSRQSLYVKLRRYELGESRAEDS